MTKMATKKTDDSPLIKQELDDVQCNNETMVNNNCKEGCADENIMHIKDEFVNVELECSFEKPAGVNLENSLKRNIKLYMCHVCGFATKVQSRLQEHKNSHKNVNTNASDLISPNLNAPSDISENKSNNSESNNDIFLKTDNPYTCTVCEKTFAKSFLLKNHMSVHNTSRPFMCNICPKRYKLHVGLQRHLGTHEVYCALCTHRFAQQSLLQTHLSEEHGIDSQDISEYVRYGHGDKLLENENNIYLGTDEIGKTNLSEKQVKVRCYTCSTCGKTFNARSRLRRHLFTHVPKKFACEICSNRFSQSSSLRRHMQNVHKVSSEDQITYKCFDSGIDREVLDEPSIRMALAIDPEIKKEVSIEIDGKSCKICGRKCRNRNVLRNHMFVHTTKRPYECYICKKAYKVHATLRRHLTTHMEKKFECDVCKKRFVERSSLRRHVRTFHDPYSSEKSVHNCDSCHKTFTSSAKYQRHCQLHGNPNTECPVCSKAFHGLSQLKVHMRIHSGEKPFFCEICKASFTFKHVMITHQERLHQIYTRHKCNVCSILFRSKAELVLHTTTHVLAAPEDFSKPIKQSKTKKKDKIQYYSMLLPYLNVKGKPNECKECAESFATRRDYMNHVIDHIISEFQVSAVSSAPSYNCRICNQTNFEGETQFKKHLHRHVKLPKAVFKCKSCGKKFHHFTKYTKHKNTHREYFRCDYCRKRFYKKHLLIDHIEAHSFIKCLYCEKIFHDTPDFLKHFDIFHEEKMSTEEFLNDEDELIIVA